MANEGTPPSSVPDSARSLQEGTPQAPAPVTTPATSLPGVPVGLAEAKPAPSESPVKETGSPEQMPEAPPAEAQIADQASGISAQIPVHEPIAAEGEPFDPARDTPAPADVTPFDPAQGKPISEPEKPSARASAPEPSGSPTSASASPPSAPGSTGSSQAAVAPAKRDLLARARVKMQERKKIKLGKIMAELEKKGSITNNGVEKLLHVSDATATRYLSLLEKEGAIRQIGKTGPGVGYIKA